MLCGFMFGAAKVGIFRGVDKTVLLDAYESDPQHRAFACLKDKEVLITGGDLDKSITPSP